MAKNSVSRHIAGDRARAGFFAFFASLPGLALAAGLIYVIIRVIADAAPDERQGAFALAAILGVFALLFVVIARWSYDSAHAALTPQRVQAMWLRRFQAEGGDAFRPSRVIDRLSRHGISALTLQDRDVQLSWEQRRNRLAPIFWLLFIPITAFFGYFGFTSWEKSRADILNMPQASSLQEGIGQIFAAFISMLVVLVLLIVIVFGAIMLAVLLVMLIAAISGPIGAMFARNRDDFRKMPRLMRNIMAGHRKRGAVVLRISDAHWQEAVRAGLKAADAAIIDLSSVTDHIAWEIGEAVKACGPDALVFICKQGPNGARALAPQAIATIRATLGRDPGGVVFYPATRARERVESKRFARDLREAIYAAADRRRATL